MKHVTTSFPPHSLIVYNHKMKTVLTLSSVILFFSLQLFAANTIDSFKKELNENEDQWRIQEAILLLEKHGYSVRKAPLISKDGVVAPLAITNYEIKAEPFHFNNAIKFYASYINQSAKPISSFDLTLTFYNEFGDMLLQELIPHSTYIKPDQVKKDLTYRYWVDNPKINNDAFDVLQDAVETQKIKVDLKISNITY